MVDSTDTPAEIGFTTAQLIGNTLRALGFEDGDGKGCFIGGNPSPDNMGVITFSAEGSVYMNGGVMLTMLVGFSFRATVYAYDPSGELLHEAHYDNIPNFICDKLVAWAFQKPVDHEMSLDIIGSNLDGFGLAPNDENQYAALHYTHTVA